MCMLFAIFLATYSPAFGTINVNQKGYICHSLDADHAYKKDVFMAIYFQKNRYQISKIFFDKNKKQEVKFNLLAQIPEEYNVYGEAFQSILLENKNLGFTVYEIDIFNSSLTSIATKRKYSCKGYHLKEALFAQLRRIEEAIINRGFQDYNNKTYDMRFQE